MNVAMKSQSNRITQSVYLLSLFGSRGEVSSCVYIMSSADDIVIYQATTNKGLTHIAPTRALLPPLIQHLLVLSFLQSCMPLAGDCTLLFFLPLPSTESSQLFCRVQ